jgi:hypothetical protein
METNSPMSEEELLLRELISEMRTTALDMGGKHKYALKSSGHKLVTEIKGYLYEKDRADE